MWLVVGLGNPGRRYARTRHNIGFMVVEELAGRYHIELAHRREGYKIGRGSIEGQRAFLVEPLLFMNMSGPPVHRICRKYDIPPENLIIVHDDLDLEPGRLRIRKSGSSGGHRGVESIIQSIGSREFIRVKVGIGRDPSMTAEDYVLGKFTKAEMALIKESIARAADAVSCLIAEGVEKAMNRFNA